MPYKEYNEKLLFTRKVNDLLIKILANRYKVNVKYKEIINDKEMIKNIKINK